MPECTYYATNGVCTQSPDCTYRHVDPQSKIPECMNYKELGFCPDGPKCIRRHIRRVICPLYLTGFCPKGPTCELTHPKFNPALITGRFKIKTDEQIIKARKLLALQESAKSITPPAVALSIPAKPEDDSNSFEKLHIVNNVITV
ncbi:unnamed protein product [[Candida] boidinii]|nr:unnamed protein product [[Candida] boidinii]